MKLVLRQP